MLFFIIIVSVYFIIPNKMKWIFLLAASYYFYMCWRVEYIVLILLSTIVDYICGIKIHESDRKSFKKLYLLISIVVNLGILIIFKYHVLIEDTLVAIGRPFNIYYIFPDTRFLLPVGISFYTFQTLSYTIDVYRKKKIPERHLGIFALYVSFFPQLVAGPIERSVHLLPQFRKKKTFDYCRVKSGAILVLWGLFKKLVIADRAAIFVDDIYGHPELYGGILVVFATYLFAYQIYCDFSGYSDIAIGTARILGYSLMRNFDRPYASRSISEFWQRWHISLSTWFRDYVYIPLGGNRVKHGRWCLNILIVFVVSGMWHGANWTFFVWGALHGIFIICERTLGVATDIKSPMTCEKNDFVRVLRHGIGIIVTFNLVSLGWVFFRAATISDAFAIIFSVFDVSRIDLCYFETSQKTYDLRVLVFWAFVMELMQFMHSKYKLDRWLSNQNILVRWCCYYFLLFAVLMFGEFSANEFIYFQF